MQRSTALMRIDKVVESGTANLRVRLRERALDEWLPRIWMESLEQRRMLSDGFGVNGWSVGTFAGLNGYALPTVMATTPEGKIVVAGCAGERAGDWGLARFNSDGSPDKTFGSSKTGTQMFSLGQWSYPDNVLVQADGRILVTGECGNGLAIARFNEDGSLDTSFGGGAKVYDVFNGFNPSFIDFEDGAWLTPEGKVMLVAQSGADVVTMRLTSHGQIDRSFALDGMARATVDTAGDQLGLDSLVAARSLRGGGIVAYVDVWSYPVDPSSPDEINYDADPGPQLLRVQLDEQGRLVSRKVVETAGKASSQRWPDYIVKLGEDGSAYFTVDVNGAKLEKLDPNGNIDMRFGNRGLADLPGRFAEIRALTAAGGIAVQTGADDTECWGERSPDIMLRADGSVDTSFNGGGQFGTGGHVAIVPMAGGV